MFNPKYKISFTYSKDMSAFNIVHGVMLAMSNASIEHSILSKYKLECLQAAHKNDIQTVLRITGNWVFVKPKEEDTF